LCRKLCSPGVAITLVSPTLYRVTKLLTERGPITQMNFVEKLAFFGQKMFNNGSVRE